MLEKIAVHLEKTAVKDTITGEDLGDMPKINRKIKEPGKPSNSMKRGGVNSAQKRYLQKMWERKKDHKLAVRALNEKNESSWARYVSLGRAHKRKQSDIID